MNADLHIALVSTNKEAYSETFIHHHIKHLPGLHIVLFGGYLPKYYSYDRLISYQLIDSGSLVPYMLFSHKSKMQWLIHRIAKLLRRNTVSVVLAEYGPSGVEMMPICQRLKIPLVVHFHGYDAL